MALVKCTKEIKQHVQQKIDELFKERISIAYTLRGMTEKEIAEEIYSRIHTPARLKSLEEMQADVAPNFHILGYSNDFVCDAYATETLERRINAKWPSERSVLPPFSNTYHAPDVKVLSDAAKLAITEAAARRAFVIKEREAFKAQFNAAYDQVKSVNELVKLWPAVVELLPAGTMDRINRKTGPRVPTDAESINAAALSVQLLKAKVAK